MARLLYTGSANDIEVPSPWTTRTPEDGCFSGVVSFTMLHHIRLVLLQDRLLAEARRVLHLCRFRRGG